MKVVSLRHIEARRVFGRTPGSTRGRGKSRRASPPSVLASRQTRTTLFDATSLGGPDSLVNNAAGNFVRPAEILPEKAFANVVDIVLNGTFNASRAAG